MQQTQIQSMIRKKRCSKCRKLLPETDFYYSRRNKDHLYGMCKICQSEYGKNYKYTRHYRRKWKQKSYYERWARSILTTHKAKGYIINTTWQQLMKHAQTINHCPLCGCKLNWERSCFGAKQGPTGEHNTPSLDRINNDNIIDLKHCWIICWKCNTIKLNRPLMDFLDFCKTVLIMQGYTVIPKALGRK